MKTVRFGVRTYIGDPINAVKIFNGKEVDELVLFDIDATAEGRGPNYALIEDIVSEAFIPVAYGGGIRSMAEIERLYNCGIEKVVLSSCLAEGDQLIADVSARFGAQAVVVCLQVKRGLLGRYTVHFRSGKAGSGEAPEVMVKRLAARGAGEVIVYAIDRDGTFAGFDLPLLKRVAEAVDVPVVACGGARDLSDLAAAITEARCSAVAAGSMFVYQSKTRGVLISYPPQRDLIRDLFNKVNV